jgi:hypothetical protein
MCQTCERVQTKMNIKIAFLILSLFAATRTFADVTVAPATPLEGDVITIRVANAFGAEASVGSATITRAGNAFTIQQNVNIACNLPSNPVVASQFQVGPLAPGPYTVTANISFTGGPAPCGPLPPIAQSVAFAVLGQVPALETAGFVGLLLLLGVVGFMKMRS